mmetsp:Transcript_19979/g.42685  ORF Transcript_19979/g.42685 Transcript_19979/m.42685 type:complete len:141 (+) Transcript_19979:951-1373(+)
MAVLAPSALTPLSSSLSRRPSATCFPKKSEPLDQLEAAISETRAAAAAKEASSKTGGFLKLTAEVRPPQLCSSSLPDDKDALTSRRFDLSSPCDMLQRRITPGGLMGKLIRELLSSARSSSSKATRQQASMMKLRASSPR